MTEADHLPGFRPLFVIYVELKPSTPRLLLEAQKIFFRIIHCCG